MNDLKSSRIPNFKKSFSLHNRRLPAQRIMLASLLKPALAKCLIKREAKRLPDHLVIYATHDAQTVEGYYVKTSQGVISCFLRLRTSLLTVRF